MNTYIGIEGNKLRMKADFQEPDIESDKYYDGNVMVYPNKYSADMKAYKEHLSSLPVIEAVFEVEIGKEYTEGVHFEKQHQVMMVYNRGKGDEERWVNVAKVNYDDYIEIRRRIVALPISKQEAIPEVSKEEQLDRIDKLGENEYLDLTGQSDEAKGDFVNLVSVGCARELLKTFLSVGLKSHIEQMVTDEISGKEFVLSFRTVNEHLKRFPLAATPSPSPTIKSAEEVLDESLEEKYTWEDKIVNCPRRIIHAAMEQYASQFRDKPSK